MVLSFAEPGSHAAVSSDRSFSRLEESLAPTPPAGTRVTRCLGERLELVRNLWKTVLRSELSARAGERLLRSRSSARNQ